MTRQKKKRKLRVKGLIFLLLFLYLLIMFGYYVFSVPVKRIVVIGNDLVSENEILKIANIKEKMPLFKIKVKNITKKIERIDLINNVRCQKNFFGKLTITVEENKLLFYNNVIKKLVLSNGTEIEDTGIYLGYPTLINYVPSEIYSAFIKGVADVNTDILNMISEIEYSPDRYEDKIVDDKRFLMRMNDGNRVYINVPNLKKLNKYQTIYASIGEDDGTLYLDSSSNNYIFNTNKDNDKNEN